MGLIRSINDVGQPQVNPKNIATVADLLFWNDEIAMMAGNAGTPSALFKLLEGRITEWNKFNNRNIQIAWGKISELQAQYMVMKEGLPELDADNKPVFLEGKDKKEYEEKIATLLQEKIENKTRIKIDACFKLYVLCN